MTQPSNKTCQFGAGQPVSNPYKFDDEIAWLQEAARYFANRPTGGDDAAHWSNVCNAENANKIASHLDALSSRPAPMEAVAWREKVEAIVKLAFQSGLYTGPDGGETMEECWPSWVAENPEFDAILALIATPPVQALDSSLRDTHRAAVTDVLADCPGCGVAPLRLHKADCEIMLSRTPASDTTGGYEAAGQRSEPKSTHPVQGGEG